MDKELKFVSGQFLITLANAAQSYRMEKKLTPVKSSVFASAFRKVTKVSLKPPGKSRQLKK